MSITGKPIFFAEASASSSEVTHASRQSWSGTVQTPSSTVTPEPLHATQGTSHDCATIVLAICEAARARAQAFSVSVEASAGGRARVTLSPRARMLFAPGPMKQMPALASASGRVGNSEAWPQPGTTACGAQQR